jgi:putative Mn2+ efflux pump MntP
VLLVLSIATSIDALVVGISFAFVRVAIITPIIIIGIITFLLSSAGTYIGNRVGHFFERKIEFIGGSVLILIGTKFLIEHLI